MVYSDTHSGSRELPSLCRNSPPRRKRRRKKRRKKWGKVFEI
jgi:hypothetical protein